MAGYNVMGICENCKSLVNINNIYDSHDRAMEVQKQMIEEGRWCMHCNKRVVVESIKITPESENPGR